MENRLGLRGAAGRSQLLGLWPHPSPGPSSPAQCAALGSFPDASLRRPPKRGHTTFCGWPDRRSRSILEGGVS